ncbi:MAG: two-component regulator propeller domain-containing protein [Bacteroidota bacterium]
MKRHLSLLLIIASSCSYSIAQTNTWYTFPTNTPEAANRYIYVDNKDQKWIGGYSGGLHKFSNGVWTTYSTSNSALTDDDVREAYFDNTGKLWVTTWNKLNRLDTATNVWTNYNVTGQSNDILYSTVVDSSNRVWVGTDGGTALTDGLYMYNGSTWRFYNPTNSALTGRWIVQMRKDKLGKIWGVARDLFEINDTVITNHNVIGAGFPLNNGSTCIDFDSHNNVWLGVYDGGIGKFDGSNWVLYNSSNSPLPENKIWSIAVDQNDVVWIGTETAGLIKFDGVNWTTYNTSNSAITNNRIDALSVDKLNNVWIASNYGGIVVHNPQGLSGISGNVYYDRNNNNVKDATEPNLPNQLISIGTSTFNAITDASGNYKCAILNAGSYTAKLAHNNPYLLSTSPDSINFTINNTTTNLNNRNFGIHLQPNVNDIAVDYTSINLLRPGFSYTCNLTAVNQGSLRADNMTLKLTYDNNLILDSTSFAYQISQGDSIVWHIDSLHLFEQKSIKVYFHLPVNTGLIGTTLTSVASLRYATADVNMSNNTFYLNELVRGSFDPNDKSVAPEGSGTTGDIPSSTPDLTYTIRFQNTGNAEAINVLLKDTISSNLDLSSLQMLSSSHAYSAEIKTGGIVWWHFNNINLPDSTQNEVGSHGYIKYKLRLKPNLVNGTQIKNTGYIYFDFNPAIITNRTLNTINNLITSAINIGNEDEQISIYPNPFTSSCTIEFSSEQKNTTVQVMDVLGKQVKEINFGGYHCLLEKGNLNAGIYFLRIIDEQKKVVNAKLVIE